MTIFTLSVARVLHFDPDGMTTEDPRSIIHLPEGASGPSVIFNLGS